LNEKNEEPGMKEEMVNLPAEYAAAERLATAMLAAATSGDWQTVVSLRREIPGMARSLDRQWTAIRSVDPLQVRRLEKERIGAIRRVLAVDDQIRRLSDAWGGPLDRLLRGTAATRTLN
jgi:hypothetical protein